jgi:hypothetical protein
MDEHNNAQPKTTKMRSTQAQNKQEHNMMKKKKMFNDVIFFEF